MTTIIPGTTNNGHFVAVSITDDNPAKSIKNNPINHASNISAFYELSKRTIKRITESLPDYDAPSVHIVLSQQKFGDYGFVTLHKPVLTIAR